MEEIWKNVHIEHYKDYYMVSNMGKVKSLKSNKILNSHNRCDYLSVYLENNIIKKRSTIGIHSLVANAYCDKLQTTKKLCINHKDGDKKNNIYTNLEWITYSQNTKHAYDTGLKQKSSIKISIIKNS